MALTASSRSATVAVTCAGGTSTHNTGTDLTQDAGRDWSAEFPLRTLAALCRDFFVWPLVPIGRRWECRVCKQRRICRVLVLLTPVVACDVSFGRFAEGDALGSTARKRCPPFHGLQGHVCRCLAGAGHYSQRPASDAVYTVRDEARPDMPGSKKKSTADSKQRLAPSRVGTPVFSCAGSGSASWSGSEQGLRTGVHRSCTKPSGLPRGGRPRVMTTTDPSRGSSSCPRRVCSRTVRQPDPRSSSLRSAWLGLGLGLPL